MEGLILLRYHKDMSQKAVDRWELVENLMDSNRELRRLYLKARQIMLDYQDLLHAHVDDEPNKWIRAFNLFCLDLGYDWSYSKAVKRFSKAVERITFS